MNPRRSRYADPVSIRSYAAPLLVLVACTGRAGEGDADASTSASVSVSYAACDDPIEGCDGADCRRRDDAVGSWSACVPPCREDADCPAGGGGNVPVVCDGEGRCVLQCVPQIMSCPSGSRCIDGEVPQCMWPASG